MGYGPPSGGGGGGGIIVSKPATTARPNNAVISADPDLVLTALPAGRYVLDGLILWTSNAAADIACNIRGDVALATSFFFFLMKTAANAVPYSIAQGPEGILANDSTANWPTADTNVNAAQLNGVLNLAAPATISFIWAQNVANAVATSVLAGSWIRATLSSG